MRIVDFHRWRRRTFGRAVRRRIDLAGALAIAGMVIAVGSGATWLIQDARDLSDSFGPAEGSLIVNINTASEEQLISVPGLGATRAAQIVAGRPYESVDDLSKIAGVAGKTLDSLRPFVTVEGETRERE